MSAPFENTPTTVYLDPTAPTQVNLGESSINELVSLVGAGLKIGCSSGGTVVVTPLNTGGFELTLPNGNSIILADAGSLLQTVVILPELGDVKALLGKAGDLVKLPGSATTSQSSGRRAQAQTQAGNHHIDGGEGNDTIQSGAGRDLLMGGSGNDFIQGGDGKNILLGGAGNDTLVGGKDSDRLQGGLGKDSLTGGGGKDQFRFEKAAIGKGKSLKNVDVITDFNPDEDLLEFGKNIFKGKVKAADGDANAFGCKPLLNESDFATVQRISDGIGSAKIVYESSTGLIYANSKQGLTALVQVDAGLDMSASNFELFY